MESKCNTHKFLYFSSVFDLDIRFRRFVDDLEREVLDISLHLNIVEFATDETFSVEYTKRVKNQYGSLRKKTKIQHTYGWGSLQPDSSQHLQ